MDRKPTRFEIRLPPDLGDQIDSWRRNEADLPPRAEAARRLIERGLQVTVDDLIQHFERTQCPDMVDALKSWVEDLK
jgi:hypothetical protein